MPKYSDTVITGSDRYEAQGELASNERTDAVTSGIATGAEKSGSTLKDPLFSANDDLGGTETNEISEITNPDLINRAIKVVSSRDTDDADFGDETGDLLDSQVKVHGIKAIQKHRNNKRGKQDQQNNDQYTNNHNKDDVVTNKTQKNNDSHTNSGLGQLKEKKYQTDKYKTHMLSKLQSQKNQRTSQSINTKRSNNAISIRKKKTESTFAPPLGSSMFGIGATGMAVIILATFIIALLILGSLAGDEDTAETDGLSGNEKIVAEFLLGKGLEPLQTAAIMGNIQAESNFNPALVEKGSGVGHGLCQWGGDGVRLEGLVAYTKSKNKPWTDIHCQLEYLWSEMTNKGDAKNFVEFQGWIFDIAEFKKITDLEEAVYYFGRKFERPNEAYAHWDRRISSAWKYYMLLGGNNNIITEAKKHLGKPYVWGAEGPNSFDCSGFVYYVYKQCGINTTRTTAQGYYNMSTKIAKKDASPGDLVFFGSGTTGISHIGIYLGSGKFIHAPSTGDVVKITKVSAMGNAVGYGRIT